MEAIRLFKSLNPVQRKTFLACFLGWALDALDFFLLTFVLIPVAHDFGRSIPQVAFAITLTLMMRPVGAFIFGLLGDRFGRRIPLMTDIIFYSLMELLTAFAPNFTVFLILRALFGIGMGGEWGVGASLTMEVAPPKWRGLLSGILQSGYTMGFLLAAEQLLLALVGGGLGYALGILLARVVGQRIFGAAPEFSFLVLAVIVGLAAIVTLLGSAIPLRRASRYEPAPILRGE